MHLPSNTGQPECASIAGPGIAATQMWAVVGTVLALVVGPIYLLGFAYRGWIPHDAGTLAQCAWRVQESELPHRDFDALYTGGLSFLHASIFALLGTSLWSLRTGLLIISVFYCWSLVRVSRQFLKSPQAELTALACIAWSLPNYFSSMPSWYNLFFSLFGIQCTFAFIRTSQLRWLWVAGFWGGASVAIKVVGLYYIGAIIFFLVFRAIDTISVAHPSGSRNWGFAGIACSVAMTWLFLLGTLLSKQLDGSVIVHMFLPSIVVCFVLVLQSIRTPYASYDQCITLIKNLAVFLSGVLLPLGLLAVPYVYFGAIEDFVHGVLIKPLTRLDGAVYHWPSLIFLILEIPLAAWLLCGFAKRGKYWLIALLLSSMLFAYALNLSAVAVKELGFTAMRLSLPVMTGISGWILISFYHSKLNSQRRQQLFLMTAMAAFTALIQFPFAAPIYFCFVVALQLLLLFFTLSVQPYSSDRIQQFSVVVCLLFAVAYVNRLSFFEDPRLVRSDPPINKLDVPRAGLRVNFRDKSKYEALVKLIQENCGDDEYIWASPDCPEVYFLAERRNPTRTLFEMFDSPEANLRERLRMLEDKNIKVVVLNLQPSHSPNCSRDLILEVLARYSRTRVLGNFLVCFEPRAASVSE